MILDILSSDITIDGEMDFEAATPGPLDVAVNPPGADGINCHDANGNEWIEPGDKLNLLWVWCDIPYGFQQGSGECHLGIVFRNAAGENAIISQFAGNSALTIPDICHGVEFPGGIFIPCPTGVQRWRWNLTSAFALNVSMVGLPAALAGQTVKVQLHFMVQHTKQLQAADVVVEE